MLNRPFDIRLYKRGLRKKYKDVRSQMPPDKKASGDQAILRHILGCALYKRAKAILCFVSMPIEVDTHALIETAVRDGKTVAVPYCVAGTRSMHFYRIHSLQDLTPRTFGVLEPDPNRHEKVVDFQDSLCILPGLAFDWQGYRLGYGGGYYDRFLSREYSGVTMGICYRECMLRHLHHGRYDVPCHYLVTQAGVRKIHRLKNEAPASRGSGHNSHQRCSR